MSKEQQKLNPLDDIYALLTEPNRKTPFWAREFPSRIAVAGENGISIMLNGGLQFVASEYGESFRNRTQGSRREDVRETRTPSGVILYYSEYPTLEAIQASKEFAERANNLWHTVKGDFRRDFI